MLRVRQNLYKNYAYLNLHTEPVMSVVCILQRRILSRYGMSMYCHILEFEFDPDVIDLVEDEDSDTELNLNLEVLCLMTQKILTQRTRLKSKENLTSSHLMTMIIILSFVESKEPNTLMFSFMS